MWTDYRDRAKKFPIRVRGDVPFPARVRNNQCSCVAGADEGRVHEQGLLGRFDSHGLFWIWLWPFSSFNWLGPLGPIHAEDGG
eukprot:9489143-Pyramimonas_sp.AAC.1